MSVRSCSAFACCSFIALLSAAADRADAQCVTLDPPCTNEAPVVSITPSSGTSFSSASQSVTVTWTDDGGLNFGTRSVKVNGTPVTLGFTQHSSYSGVTSGSVQLTSGSNVIWAYICDTMSSCTTMTATYTYTPPPPPQQHAPPQLSLLPHHPGVSAPSPFDGQAAYATPAYVSMDQPRSLALLYSSSRARPTAFVQFDAIDNSTAAVSRIGVKIKNASGAFVTLINGSQEMFYNGAHGKNRVAAQWDVSQLATGAYKYTVVARTYFTDGASAESTDTTRVIVVNEAQGPFGAGWTMPGLQRLHIQTDGVVVTEGDGSAVFYRSLGGGAFATPEGDFAALSLVSSNYRRTYPDGSVAVFAASTGLLSYVEDRFGNRTSYGYTSGRLTSVADPASKAFTLAYNASGKLTTITDAVSRVTSVTVNGSGDLTQIVAPGSTTAFSATYDSSHRMRTRTDMRGKTSGYAYDFSGRVAADTLPSVTLHTGGSTRPVIAYKAWESATLVSACACNRPHINPDTLRAIVTDPVGNATRIAYDRYFGPVKVDAPLNHTTTIYRNGNGLPTYIAEPSGASRSYNWDAYGNVTSIQQPETSQNIYITYHTTWKTDPVKVVVGGSETLYSYGTSGQLMSVRVNQDSTRYEYFTDWRLKKVTDPQGHATNFTYQTTGFKNSASVSETSSAGTARTTTFAYDSYGRTSGVTVPAGTTSYLYDILDRVTRVTDATTRATNYTYDGPYVATVTDAVGKVFSFNRNNAGWIVSEVDPNSRTTSYGYDAAGNTRKITNRRSQVITMVPDALGRAASRTADGLTTTYAYDNPAGRWVATANSQSTDSIFYDDRGRVTREVALFGTQKYQVVSKYLREGPRDTVQIIGPTWNRTVAYGYNNALQLTSLSQLVGGVNKITSIAYNKDGLPSVIGYPTSTPVQQSLGYSASHRPQHNGWSGTVSSVGVSYAYDSMERLTKRTNAAGDSARILSYNARNELTNVKDEEYTAEWVCPTMEITDCYWDEQTTVVSNVPYTYDAVWNRTGTGTSLQSTSNRYQTFGGFTFEYDLDGNMTRKYKSGFDQYFSWNSLGQLTAVTTNGATVTYGYNGFGERIYRAAGSDVRRFVYDGPNVILEVSGTGTRLREYTHFPGVDQPHSMFDGNTVYYYATDYPGHVAGLFNASGSLVNRYRYSAWGQPETTSEGVSNSLRFMSRELDSQTGVYYVRNRWYDAAVARFLSEDPIGLEGGINLYAYAGNSPGNFTDPFGLDYDSPCVRGFYSTNVTAYTVSVTYTCTRFADQSVGNRGAISYGESGAADDRGGGVGAMQRSETNSIASCGLAVGELLARGALDFALGYVYYMGAGLVVRGGLLFAEGWGMSTGLILTQTARTAGATGAMEMLYGRTVLRLGIAQVGAGLGAAQLGGGRTTAKAAGLSSLPRNAYNFWRNGGFAACQD